MQNDSAMVSLARGASGGPSNTSGATDPEGRGADGVKDAGAWTVLVVDDDLAVLEVASKVLTRGGFEVIQAHGAREALAVAEAEEVHVSLLLTDVVMPGMSGRELSDRFRELRPEVPILFMSAYTEDEIILQGVRLAEVHFIAKPFTVEGLRKKVTEVIRSTSD